MLSAICVTTQAFTKKQCCNHDCNQGRTCRNGRVDPDVTFWAAVILFLLINLFVNLAIYVWL